MTGRSRTLAGVVALVLVVAAGAAYLALRDRDALRPRGPATGPRPSVRLRLGQV